MLRDILSGEDKAIAAILEVISAADPDILLLTDFDHDAGLAALNAFADLLAKRGTAYPFRFALPSNAGLPTGFDMDGNGALGEARDAMGYGDFSGNGGMALLSRVPIDTGGVADFTDLLWRDLPGTQLPKLNGRPFPSEDALAIQRLASAGFWIVPVLPEGGGPSRYWQAPQQRPPLMGLKIATACVIVTRSASGRSIWTGCLAPRRRASLLQPSSTPIPRTATGITM